jgi:hypothetical protein
VTKRQPRDRASSAARRARRATARIAWPEPAGWQKAIEAFGPLPPEGQRRLAIRLASAYALNRGIAALTPQQRKCVRFARARLVGINDAMIEAIVIYLDRRFGGRRPKSKEPHTTLLEALFEAYVVTRLEHPGTGSIGWDTSLLVFLNLVLDVAGLGPIADDGMIGEEEARNIWRRWSDQHEIS